MVILRMEGSWVGRKIRQEMNACVWCGVFQKMSSILYGEGRVDRLVMCGYEIWVLKWVAYLPMEGSWVGRKNKKKANTCVWCGVC